MTNLETPQPQRLLLSTQIDQEKESLARSYTIVIYALFLFGVFAFLPWIAGAILIYVKRESMAETLYESHATWCLRTFWYSMLWEGLAVLIAVMTFGAGLIVAWPVFFGVHIWVLYRIIKGAVQLIEKQPLRT